MPKSKDERSDTFYVKPPNFICSGFLVTTLVTRWRCNRRIPIGFRQRGKKSSFLWNQRSETCLKKGFHAFFMHSWQKNGRGRENFSSKISLSFPGDESAQWDSLVSRTCAAGWSEHQVIRCLHLLLFSRLSGSFFPYIYSSVLIEK